MAEKTSHQALDGESEGKELSLTDQVPVAAGAFLSGSMASISFIGVNVLLDTSLNESQAPQLLYQWATMYDYGHRIMPALAITTFGLYLYGAVKRRAAKKDWKKFALAGLTTLGMIPFTLIIMAPTNSELSRLEAASKSNPAVASLTTVRGLVVSWYWFHISRSLFPAAGSLLGTWVMYSAKSN